MRTWITNAGGNAVRMRITNAGTGHRPFGKRSKAGRHFARRVAAGSNARLLACVLAVGAGLVGATSAWAQAPDGSGSTHRAASEANTRAQTLSSPRGLRLGVDLTAGRPFLRGDAAVIWDRIGSVGIVEGFGVRLGYDFGRLGLTLTGELSEFDPGDRAGAGIGFAALLHWRPQLTIGRRFGSRITAGYVRQGYGGIDFVQGQFPAEVVEGFGSRPAEAGNVYAIGDGVRFGFGLEALTSLSFLRAVVDASVDAVTFRQASLEGFSYSLLEPGWSFYPRISVALELNPFSR